MERRVANLRVREVGTLGGNLCFSDPHSDPATFLLAVDAEVECRRGGEPARRTPIADFVVGPYQTSLEQGELLTAVRIPRLREVRRSPTRSSRSTSGRRRRSRVWRGWSDGVLAEARVAVGSVGVRPVRSRGGRGADGSARRWLDGVLATAGERAAEDAAPVDDATGSADYKAQLVKVLVERTFPPPPPPATSRRLRACSPHPPGPRVYCLVSSSATLPHHGPAVLGDGSAQLELRDEIDPRAALRRSQAGADRCLAPPLPLTSFAFTASTATPSASSSCSCLTSDRNCSEIGPSLTFCSFPRGRRSCARASRRAYRARRGGRR